MVEWGTVELREILWTLATIPGLWYWFRNYLYARGTAKMVQGLDKKDGRALWARFSVSLTRGLIGLEMVFVFIGVRGFFLPSSTVVSDFQNWLLAFIFIAASVGISYLGVRWKMVDDALVQSARKKSRDKQAKVKADHLHIDPFQEHKHHDSEF